MQFTAVAYASTCAACFSNAVTSSPETGIKTMLATTDMRWLWNWHPISRGKGHKAPVALDIKRARRVGSPEIVYTLPSRRSRPVQGRQVSGRSGPFPRSAVGRVPCLRSSGAGSWEQLLG